MEKINIISEVEDSSENSKDDVNELLSLKIPEHVLNTFNSEIRGMLHCVNQQNILFRNTIYAIRIL